MHHMVLAAGHTLNEVYTFRDMLKQDDRAEFVKAMGTEVREHEKRKHWEVVKRSSVPEGTKTIQSIWSFKRKRFPLVFFRNIRLAYVHMMACNNGESTIGRRMLLL